MYYPNTRMDGQTKWFLFFNRLMDEEKKGQRVESPKDRLPEKGRAKGADRRKLSDALTIQEWNLPTDGGDRMTDCTANGRETIRKTDCERSDGSSEFFQQIDANWKIEGSMTDRGSPANKAIRTDGQTEDCQTQ